MWDQTRLPHDPRPLYFGNILTLGCPLHIKISTKFLIVFKGHVLNHNFLGPKEGVLSFSFTKFPSVFQRLCSKAMISYVLSEGLFHF
jgi:hypothetical protein